MKPVRNVRRQAALYRAAFLVPVLLLPVAAGGVTVRPALELREVQREETRLQELQAHCDARRTALAEFGSLEKLAVFEALRRELGALVPDSLEPMEIYSQVRHAALVAGVDLGSVRLTEPTDTGLALDGRTVAAQNVALTGEAELGPLVQFVAGLEARGLPLAVTYLNLGRDRRDQATFRFDLEVGLFHYAPAGAFAASLEESSAPAPGGE